jgi:antitoxin MazE
MECQMKTQLSKWGNSLAVRIPKPVARAAQFYDGDTLDLYVEGLGAVRICKSTRKPILKQLVARITEENRHGETDWGEAVGREVW